MANKEHYNLHLVTLNANDVFNWLAPRNVSAWYHYPEWHDTWWSQETVQLRTKYEQFWIDKFDQLTGHFTLLEKSILKEGILHPIKTVVGLPSGPMMNKPEDIRILPPTLQGNISAALVTHQFGGSRVTVAQKYNMDVPCLVYDKYGTYCDHPKVNEKELKQLFGTNYSYGKYPNGAPMVRIRTHVHAPSGSVVPRELQQQAGRSAREKMIAFLGGSQ